MRHLKKILTVSIENKNKKKILTVLIEKKKNAERQERLTFSHLDGYKIKMGNCYIPGISRRLQ